MSLISTLAIPKLDVDFCELYIYIFKHVAVSCKRYPPSLPYIIIVQTCGKRWDLPKFVDVLSVSPGLSRLLIYIYIYIYLYIYIHVSTYIYIYIHCWNSHSWWDGWPSPMVFHALIILRPTVTITPKWDDPPSGYAELPGLVNLQKTIEHGHLNSWFTH